MVIGEAEGALGDGLPISGVDLFQRFAAAAGRHRLDGLGGEQQGRGLQGDEVNIVVDRVRWRRCQERPGLDENLGGRLGLADANQGPGQAIQQFLQNLALLLSRPAGSMQSRLNSRDSADWPVSAWISVWISRAWEHS